MASHILVTGSDNPLGAALVRRCGAEGFSLEPSFPGPYEVVALSHEALDISRKPEVDRVMDQVKPAIVFNAAGISDADVCELRRWRAYLLHRDGAEHIARASRRHDALMVAFSTDLVFDGSKRSAYVEEDPPHPLNTFGDTKLAGELGVMRNATRHLIVRTGRLFGMEGDPVVSGVLMKMREGGELLAFDDHQGQATFVDDFVDAVLYVVAHGVTGKIHVASPGPVRDSDLAKEMLDLLKCDKVRIRIAAKGEIERTAMRPMHSMLSCARLRDTGFKLRSWKEGLKAFVENLPPDAGAQEMDVVEL